MSAPTVRQFTVKVTREQEGDYPWLVSIHNDKANPMHTRTVVYSGATEEECRSVALAIRTAIQATLAWDTL